MLRVTSNNPLTLSSDIVIPTGTGTTSQETSGVSNWAMKLTAGRTGVLTTYNPIIAGSTEDTEKQSGDTNYSNYAEVPSEYTKVAYLNSATDIPYVPEQGDPIEAVGSNFTSTYAVYISPTQPAGTYNGKVKYTVVHPSSAAAPSTSPATIYLQNTTAVTNAVNSSPTHTIDAVDSRDGTHYTVGKLADNRIWILDNLALDLTMTNASTNINASNTNASADSLSALFSGVSDGGTNGNLARTAVTNDWQSDSYTDPLIDTSDSNKTVKEAYEEDEDHSGETYEGIDATWKIGNYYNFCAASAGSYCYDDESGTGDANEDICPAGWRMPTSGYDDEADDYIGEYATIYNAYIEESDQYTAFRTALQAPLSGYFYDASAYGQGNNGSFWSSTRYDESSMYNLSVYESSIYPSNYYNRNDGLSVRCIMNNS